MSLSDFGRRAFGAARLDAAIYEEVERDSTATAQAFVIVLLAGIGSAIGRLASFDASALLAGMLVGVLGWGIWAGLALVIGAKLFPEPQTQSNPGELLRVLGFAAVPGVAQALGAVAPFRTPVLVLTEVWMILAMIIAVRQALDYTSTPRAAAVVLVGWMVQFVATVLLLAAVNPELASAPTGSSRPAETAPSAGYVGVVKPSGVAPPVE
jgi:hypothetical protein